MPTFATSSTVPAIRVLAQSDARLAPPQPILLTDGQHANGRVTVAPTGVVANLASQFRVTVAQFPDVVAGLNRRRRRLALRKGAGILGVDPGLNLGLALRVGGFTFVHTSDTPIIGTTFDDQRLVRAARARREAGLITGPVTDAEFGRQRLTLDEAINAAIAFLDRVDALCAAASRVLGYEVGVEWIVIEPWIGLDVGAHSGAQANPSFWVRTVAIEALVTELGAALLGREHVCAQPTGRVRAEDVLTALTSDDLDRMWVVDGATVTKLGNDRPYRDTRDVKANERDVCHSITAAGWARHFEAKHPAATSAVAA